MNDTLDIHSEFSRMLPTQTKFELSQLESSIKAEGRATQPLIVWREGDKRFLVDGHTRYEICNRLNLPFDVVERPFKSKREIRLFIFQQQFARRNLTDAARSIGHDTYLQLLKGPARAKAKEMTEAQPNVIAAAAADLGISKATLKRDSNVAKAVKKIKKTDPKLAEKIVGGGGGVTKKALVKLGQDKATVEAVQAEAEGGEKVVPDKPTKKPASKAALAVAAVDDKRLERIDLLEVVAEKLGGFFTAVTPAGRRKLIGEVAEALSKAEGEEFDIPVEYEVPQAKLKAKAKDIAAAVKVAAVKAPAKSAADVADAFDD